MRADDDTTAAIIRLVERTYAAMSTPGSDFTPIFGAADMAVAGSGQGELMYGPEVVCTTAGHIASIGATWRAEQVTVWQRGETAWAQILGSVEVAGQDGVDVVPYWTTGIFGHSAGGWQWLYWGGSEPQATPRV